MKLSVVVPTVNNPAMLIETLTVFKRNVSSQVEYEIIVVNQGSQSLRTFIEEEIKGTFIHIADKAVGFSKAINIGARAATGDVIFLLNDDVIVPKNAVEHMLNCIYAWTDVTKLSKVGIVGPLSNYVAGLQNISRQVRPEEVDAVAAEIEKNGETSWVPSTFISGFAMMITRECWNAVGELDENFPYGHNDTDYVIRAYQAGYYAVIAGNAFIFHWGSVSLKRHKELQIPDTSFGMSSEAAFNQKWQRLEFNKQTHLSVVMRVKIRDQEEHKLFKRVLTRNLEFADAIFILDDGSPINIASTVQSKKVVWYQKQDLPLEERRDRNLLVQTAFDYGIKHAADCNRWIISVDADEIYESKMTRAYLDRLMRPQDPLIWQYMFHWYTMWNSTEYWRADGIFGQIAGPRLFKPWGIRPQLVRGNKVGFHVEHVPVIGGAQRATSIRVKHYGYVDPQQRARKHEWYETNDTDRKPELIGASNYDHLVDETGIKLLPWIEDNGIVLTTIVKDEQRDIGQYLSKYAPFVDKVILVDTGSSDSTAEKAKQWPNVEIVHRHITDLNTIGGKQIAFDEARNVGLDKCLTTGPACKWVLHLDIDEDLIHLGWIRRAMDNAADGYIFYVRNHQKTGEPILSETVRLFRNVDKFRYTGFVHETLDECIKTHHLTIWRAQPAIEHIGFAKATPDVLQKKFEGYIAREVAQIESFPEDPRPYFNLAMHLLESPRFTDIAVELLKVATFLDPHFYHPQKELGLIYTQKACNYMKSACEILPAGHIHRTQMETLARELQHIAGERFSVIPGHVEKLAYLPQLIERLSLILRRVKETPKKLRVLKGGKDDEAVDTGTVETMD